MNDKCFVMIYIYSSLVFFFFNIMTNAYLSKHFNCINVYNGLFSNFNYYKCLSSNASKHCKMIYKRFFLNMHQNINNLLNKILMI